MVGGNVYHNGGDWQEDPVAGISLTYVTMAVSRSLTIVLDPFGCAALWGTP